MCFSNVFQVIMSLTASDSNLDQMAEKAEEVRMEPVYQLCWGAPLYVIVLKCFLDLFQPGSSTDNMKPSSSQSRRWEILLNVYDLYGLFFKQKKSCIGCLHLNKASYLHVLGSRPLQPRTLDWMSLTPPLIVKMMGKLQTILLTATQEEHPKVQ